MSNVDPDLDDLDDDDDDGQNEDERIKRLRAKLSESHKEKKALQKLVETNAEAAKKLAFIEAKLPDEPQVKFFLDHYEGDLTKEAIREAATQYGFLSAESPEQEAEVGAVEQMMKANQGASQVAAPGTDAELHERIMAVKPGKNAALEIRDIMQSAGRYQSDE